MTSNETSAKVDVIQIVLLCIHVPVAKHVNVVQTMKQGK